MNQEKKLSITKATLHPKGADEYLVLHRFEQEMDRIENEMTRYRNHVNQLEQGYYSNPSSSASEEGPVDLPIIRDTSAGKVLTIRFDVSEFKPEEIVVKVVNNMLCVEARHEEKDDETYTKKEYQRQFLLPEETELQYIQTDISSDGVLNLTVPLAEAVRFVGLVRK